MKTEQIRWARRYQAALRKHLGKGPVTSLRPAFGLGRQAVVLGLETLDLARIHRQALMALISPSGSPRTRERMIERAKSFFAETISPIEETHRAALKAGMRVHQLTQALRRRTMQSSTSIGRLKRSILLRQGAEQALQKSGKRHIRLLAELHRLQKHLRDMTHAWLSAQENERQRMSRQLHDEIAQALIAIDLRLLTLKRAARASTTSLKKEIAGTQLLVAQSARKIRRAADEYGFHDET